MDIPLFCEECCCIGLLFDVLVDFKRLEDLTRDSLRENNFPTDVSFCWHIADVFIDLFLRSTFNLFERRESGAGTSLLVPWGTFDRDSSTSSSFDEDDMYLLFFFLFLGWV